MLARILLTLKKAWKLTSVCKRTLVPKPNHDSRRRGDIRTQLSRMDQSLSFYPVDQKLVTSHLRDANDSSLFPWRPGRAGTGRPLVAVGGGARLLKHPALTEGLRRWLAMNGAGAPSAGQCGNHTGCLSPALAQPVGFGVLFFGKEK